MVDNGAPRLSVTPKVNGDTPYTDGGFTNQTVTLDIISRSYAPFQKFEISDGSTTTVISAGSAGLTVTAPPEVGGDYVAVYTYTLPAVDTDRTDYIVTAFTSSISDEEDPDSSYEYGETASSPIIYRYDNSAPQFSEENISYETVNGDPLSRVYSFLTFGLFFKEAVRIKVIVDNSSQMEGNTAKGSTPLAFHVSDTDTEHDITAPSISGGEGLYIVTFTVPVGFIGDISMYAEDNIAYGNNNKSGTVTLRQFVADTELPTVSFIPESDANAGGWYREDVTVTVSAADTLSGLYSMTIGENTLAPVIINPADRNNKYNSLSWEKTFDTSGIYYLTADAMDNAGNNAEQAALTIRLDKEVPVLSLTASTASVNPYLGAWTTEDVTLTPSASAVSGISYYYAITEPGASPTAWVQGGAVPSGWQQLPASGYIEISGDTNKDYHFIARSGSYNVSNVVTQEVRISKTKAEAPYVNLNGYIAGSWVNQDIVISLSTDGSNAPFGGTKEYQYSVYLGNDEWSDWWNITGASGNPVGTVSGDENNLTGASYTVNSDLVQTVRFRTLSNSGVESYPTAPVTVKVDKTAPDETEVKLYNGTAYVSPAADTWYDTDKVRLTVTQDTALLQYLWNTL